MALIVIGVAIGITTVKNFMYPPSHGELIQKYAKKNDLDQYLVRAVIKTESNFIADAHSGKASGLMQLTDETAKWVCEKLGIDVKKIDLYDPEDNIKLGCYYLRHLIDYYDGNIDVALAAYNGGPGNVNKWLKNKEYSKNGKDLHYIPFKETREYVVKVNEHWKNYRELYEKENKKAERND